MKEDVIVELWETRPRINERKNEDETIVKEVAISEETGRPIIDKRLRGVRFIRNNFYRL